MKEIVASEELFEVPGSSVVIRTQGGKMDVSLPFLVMGRRWKEIRPEDYQQVYLESRMVGSQNHRRTVYSVGLEGPKARLDLGEVDGDPNTAAESVAKFLDLGMENRAGGQKTTRVAGTLDDSLRQQAAKSGRPTACPCRPDDVQATFHIAGKTATFVIAECDPGSRAKILLGSTVFAFGSSIALPAFLIHWTVGLGVLAAVYAVWQWALKSLYNYWATAATVVVSPDHLEFWHEGQPHQSFTADEIEEITTGPLPWSDVALLVQFRSDRTRGLVQLRAGEPTNSWIVSTVRYLLSEDPEKIDWEALRSWT